MPRLIHKASGEVVNLEGQEYLAAVQSGAFDAFNSAGFEGTLGGSSVILPGEAAEFRGSVGAAGAVAPGQRRAAEEAAFRERAWGGFGQEALTGLEGALSGVSFGAYDVLAKAAGADTAERAETNPWVHGAGYLAGAIVPGLFTGGTGTAGSIARALPSGALLARTGRVAEALGGFKGAVSSGILEGAAFGAGQGVSNLALGNEPLTAEAALSEIGLNSLYGIAGGAGGAALGHGLGKAGSALLGRSERAGLASAGADDLLREAGLDAKAVTRGLEDAAEDVRETVARTAQGHNVRASSGQMKQAAQERFQLLNSRANSLLEDARAVNLGEGKLAGLKKAQWNTAQMAEELLDPRLRVDIGTFTKYQNKLYALEGEVRGVTGQLGDTSYERLLKDIDSLDNKWHGITDSGQRAQRMGPQAATRVNEANPILQQQVREEGRAYQEFRDRWGLGDKGVLNEAALKRFTKMSQDDAMEAASSFSNWRTHIEALAHQTADGGLPIEVKGFTAQFDRLLSEAIPGDMAGKTAMEMMTDLGLLGLVNTSVPNMAGPADDLMKLWLAHKVLKAPGALSRGFGGSIGKSLAGFGGSRAAGFVAKATGAPGVAGYVLRSQMAQLARGAVSGGNKLAQATGKAVARIEAATSKILEGSGKVSRRVGPTAATILNSTSFGGEPTKGKGKVDMQGAFKARQQELTSLMANPMAAHQRVWDNLAEVRAAHPLVADSMEMEAVADLQYFYEKMPKDPGTMVRFGLSTWKPDEGKLIGWANVLEAGADPLGQVEKVANGTVSPQGAEFLRLRRPALFAEIQKILATNIEKLQENTTHDQRVRLSVLFGVPVDSAIDQSFVQFQQQFWTERATDQKMVDGSKIKPEQPSEANKLLA